MILRDQEENPARGSVVCGKGNHWGTLPPGQDTYVLTASSNDPSGTGLTWAATGAGGTVGSTTGDAAVACPDAYGAIGDGVNDDTNAINAAIASGLDVWLTPGKTYLTWGGHILGAGQVFFGNGATLQRANQVSQVCSATVTSGSYTLSVTSPAGLKVGQMITVANAAPGSATGGTNYDTTPRLISAVSGTTVTTSTAWAVTIAGGTVYTTGWTITLGQDSRVYDLQINGNSANYTWYRWEVTREIHFAGVRGLAQGVVITNAPGEGIYFNADHTTARDCTIVSSNGNGYHLSGASPGTSCVHPTIINCRVSGSNLQAGVGHVMGCIGWSNLISDATVQGCHLDGAGTSPSGCGSIDSYDNSDVTITGNTIRNCTTTGIGGTIAASGTPSVARLAITGNRISNCGIGIEMSASQTSTYPANLSITGNVLDANTVNSIVLQQVTGVTVSGNSIYQENTTYPAIVVSSCAQACVSGNTINGGFWGIYATNTATGGGSGINNVAITGNTLVSQYSGGIMCNPNGATGWIVASNAVGNNTTAANGYVGISVYNAAAVIGNTLNLTNNGGAITGVAGIELNSSTTVGSYAISNVVRGTAQYSILAWGGSVANCIFGNIVQSTMTLATSVTVTTPAVLGTPTLSGGVIQTVPVTSGGVGYVGTPYIGTIGGGGTGATLTPVMSSGSIQSITVTSGGTGFTSPPTVYASGNFAANNQTVL